MSGQESGQDTDRMHQDLDRLLEVLQGDFGHLTVMHHQDGHWMVAMEWGQEADDSPMVGAAAYGTGDSAAEAIAGLVQDLS